jgi:hypothetical protein
MPVRRLAKGLPKPVEKLEPPAIFHLSALSNHVVGNIFGIFSHVDSSVSGHSISTRLPRIPSPGGTAR